MTLGCGLEDDELDESEARAAEVPALTGNKSISCEQGRACCSTPQGQVDVEKPVEPRKPLGCQGGGSCSSQAGRVARKAPLKKGMCVKCGEQPAEVIANQREAMCRGCLHKSLLQKFKTAINKHAMLARDDKVLLAFSGGHASRVALDLLDAVRSRATSDAAALADRGKTVFQLGVAFVDESALTKEDGSSPTSQLAELTEVVKPYGCVFHVIRLEDLWNLSSDSGAIHTVGNEEFTRLEESRKRALKELLATVKETTAQEDLVEQLREELLQQVAVMHGYNKLVRGDCATHLARKAIASITKGRGYSLPGDVQYVDARRSVPVLLPLRDCVAKELAVHCHLAGLQCVFVPTLDSGPQTRGSINRLTDAFVNMLEEDLPGRVHTILKTANKLQPFSFNTLSPSDVLAGSRKPRRPVPRAENLLLPPVARETLCAMCQAPLSHKEVLAAQRLIEAGCCKLEEREKRGMELGCSQSTNEKEFTPRDTFSGHHLSMTSGVCLSCRDQTLCLERGGAQSAVLRMMLPPLLQERLQVLAGAPDKHGAT